MKSLPASNLTSRIPLVTESTSVGVNKSCPRGRSEPAPSTKNIGSRISVARQNGSSAVATNSDSATLSSGAGRGSLPVALKPFAGQHAKIKIQTSPIQKELVRNDLYDRKLRNVHILFVAFVYLLTS